MPDPEWIINLRAYFVRTLKNEITGLYSIRGPVLLVDELEILSPPQPGPALYGPAFEPTVDDQACRMLQAQIWYEPHAAQRDSLIAGIPARSNDPSRYRALISARAEPVLSAISAISAFSPTTPTSPNPCALPTPSTSTSPDVAPNTLDQRSSRARDDIRALLQRNHQPRRTLLTRTSTACVRFAAS